MLIAVYLGFKIKILFFVKNAYEENSKFFFSFLWERIFEFFLKINWKQMRKLNICSVLLFCNIFEKMK
jgi:hypothetical protein